MRVSALEVGEQVGKGLGGLFDGLRGGYIFGDGQGLCRVVVCHDVYCSIFTRFDGVRGRWVMFGKLGGFGMILAATAAGWSCALAENRVVDEPGGTDPGGYGEEGAGGRGFYG